MKISGKAFHVEVRGQYLLRLLLVKLVDIVLRLADILRYLPARLKRVARHLQEGWREIQSGRRDGRSGGMPAPRAAYWGLELLLLLLDCLGAGELYEAILDFVKFNSRPLHPWEKELARPIFGKSINYGRVRIDEYAVAGPRQFHFCYVSFYCINSWGRMDNSLLIHELAHVWQYQKMGIVYIPRALMAQRSPEGYDYGGTRGLEAALRAGRTLQDFNLEQQAEIVSDYYRIREGYPPRWGRAGVTELPIYEHFVKELRSKG
ncbi:MAG: hypothetical protein J5I98_35185 [Phaeodactylibacter sp.]|nr:hypothetical protein [Phaeodactylibacter sp.]